MSKIVFYPDKVALHFPGFTVKRLLKSLPLSELSLLATSQKTTLIDYNSCRKAPTHHHYHPWRSLSVNFGTTLNIVCPKKKYFRKLLKYKEILDHAHISYIELAADYLCNSQVESIKLAKDAAMQTCRKWLSHYHAFSHQDQSASTPHRTDPRLYGDSTYYWGHRGNKMRMTIYPANSKKIKSQVPSVHIEWRIRGAAPIRNKIGLVTVSDILNMNFPHTFSRLFQRYINFKDIHHENHGRWLLNEHRRGNTDIQAAIKQSEAFCSSHRINTYAELRQFYKRTKTHLKKARGRRSSFQKRVLSIDYYRLTTFARTVSLPRALKRFYN